MSLSARVHLQRTERKCIDQKIQKIKGEADGDKRSRAYDTE